MPIGKLLSWALRRIPGFAEQTVTLELPARASRDEGEPERSLEAGPVPPPLPPLDPEPVLESCERLQSVRPAAPREGTALAVLMAEVIAEYRGHVLARIRKANEMTSDHVVAVANSLDAIVTRAQTQVRDTRATLDGLSGGDERDVTVLIQEQTRLSSTRFAAIRAALEEQTGLAREALRASSEIKAVGAGVTRVAFQARLLSLNANIEAARFGERGGGFQVIATEMRRLTEEIDRANRQIETMASSLMNALPKINEHADTLCRHAEDFTDELNANSTAVGSATEQLRRSVNELLASGDQAANHVLRGSQDALSHLQFQDPTAQNLLIIDADLERLGQHLEALLKRAGAESALVPDDIALDLSAADANLALNAGNVAAMDHDQASLQTAGEVLLF